MPDIPHAEHPRPQAERKHWLCLNGTWKLQKLDIQKNVAFDGEILVPFSPETLNSGLDEDFVLQSGETLVYTRSFTLDNSLLLGVTLLHFGAVDSVCEVYCNGEKVGKHRGGFTPFTMDITHVVKSGENQLKIVCADEATRDHGARGKQSDNRGGIWYTPQSGIWQTVWIESMPKNYIRDLRITPNAENKTVRISSLSQGETQTITVYDGEKTILQAEYEKEITLSYDFTLWSPENPKLYDFTITNQSGDEVKSYFGVRSFGKTHDKNGIARLTLNGKPYFFNGVLDQGYWSDGMLTYPCDEAAIDELQMLKDMGFNTVRKHIKLEPMRWYYHCDRLGLVVWQDFVNGGGEYKFTHVAAFPFLGFHHRDDDYRYFARENEGGRYEFMQMTDEIIDNLYNVVSIGVWVPFNEGWGQFDSAKITEYVREKDPTRIIDSVSGWHDQGVDKTELRSLHTYYTPLKVPKDSRPVVLSEFGGYSMKCEGHVFDESKEFGYKKFNDPEKLATALGVLYRQKLLPLIKKGLCGCIYTQVSDVEEEINGLVTYDRKVIKIPVKIMRAINDDIAAEANKVE
ncbi:MAG: glycoside hydrolase family 2 [Clostridia bacterium]|nr:glycoside hydrolase family 2 [Clostridia bacterium]